MVRFHRNARIDAEWLQDHVDRPPTWQFPNSPRAYLYAAHAAPLIHVDRSIRPRRRLPWGPIACSLAAHLLLLWPQILPRPPAPPTEEDFLIVIADARQVDALENLTIDISSLAPVDPAASPLDVRPSLDDDLAAAPPAELPPHPSTELQASEKVSRVASRGDGAADRDPEGEGGAEAFGLLARGRRFGFALDNSVSMAPHWDAVIDEVVWAVSRLRDGQQVAIILLDGQFPDALQFQAVRSGDAQRLRAWLERAVLSDTADPAQAIQRIMDLLPDALYVVSDGNLSADVPRRVKARNSVLEEHRLKLPAVVIHCVSVGGGDNRLLRQLARENGGGFRSAPVR